MWYVADRRLLLFSWATELPRDGGPYGPDEVGREWCQPSASFTLSSFWACRRWFGPQVPGPSGIASQFSLEPVRSSGPESGAVVPPSPSSDTAPRVRQVALLVLSFCPSPVLSSNADATSVLPGQTGD